MKEIIKLGLVLFFVCAIAAMALGMTNEVTKGQIADNAVIAAREARQAVYPTADDFVLIASTSDDSYEAHPSADAFLSENAVVREVYQAMTAGEHVGFVIKTAPNGYGGEVGVTVGLALDGSIQGVQVDTPNETPGLGAKAKTPEFYSQFDGLSVNSPIEVLKVEVTDENAIQSISGATITSQAVADGVNYGLAVIETFK